LNQFDINILDFIDILLVSFLIYQIYKLVQGTVAIRIVLGITALYLFWKLVEFLEMDLLSEILGQFIGVGVLALIIVFQQEIRKFLLLVGNKSFSSKKEILKRFNTNENSKKHVNDEYVIEAIKKLSGSKTGAIIVYKNRTDLSFIESSGTKVDADISSEMIQCIFFKNNPLHDGATIIEGNKITYSACVLPVSERRDLPKSIGLRHRAALGISESSDASIVIISEERGDISICKEGELHLNISLEKCREFIYKH